MRKLVLIIDDSATVRHQLEQTLVEAGHRVVVAGNGVEALEQLHRESGINIVFADINMPIMNGIEFLSAARKAGFSVPIVMVTTESGSSMVDAAKAEGAVGWIPKPFNKAALLKAVEILAKTPVNAQ